MLSRVKKLFNSIKLQTMTILYREELEPVEPDDFLSHQEFKLMEDLEKLQLDRSEEEIKNWAAHYNTELATMFYEIIYENIDLSFNEFVRIAYKCSESEFCNKEHKKIKPLISK